MKKTLLIFSTLLFTGVMYAQNIADNKVNFSYIQLPKIKIDDRFTTYEVRVTHSYLEANQDSIAMTEMRRKVAMDIYQQQIAQYRKEKDSIDRAYYKTMADWQIKVNAGAVGADGKPLPQPSQPFYPNPPVLNEVKDARQHTEMTDDYASGLIQLEGFERGLGGVIISMDVKPIRNIQIIPSKSGSGSSTKYRYKCMYTLPVVIKVESPTQGTLTEITVNENVQYYNMPEFKSEYEYKLYMMDNEDKFYSDLEKGARASSISSANQYLNDNFGYIMRNRQVEVYTVNRHKNYDYSDVTNAYTLTVQALSLVKNDRDRDGAMDKIDEALAAWKSIMEESNLNDNSARINDKISAMIRCNIAELLVWKADFNQSEMEVNLALNSGVGKAKRYIDNHVGFYADQRQRWEANY